MCLLLGVPIAMIKSLLTRGDYVAVEAGRLVITPISGKPVPDVWFRENMPAFMADIAVTTGCSIFQYQRFVVKKFGVQGHDGVMLDYVNICTGEGAQVFYNAELTRDRTTKAGKKGDPLPRGKFRVTKNHAFTKYWLSLGLSLPRRLAEFHDCMGKLGAVYVTGLRNAKGIIDKATLKPVCFSVGELKKAFLINAQSPDNSLATSRQAPDNCPTRAPDKEPPQTQALQGFQANLSTSNTSTYLSNRVGASKALPLDSLSIASTPNSVTMNYKDIPIWEPKPRKQIY